MGKAKGCLGKLCASVGSLLADNSLTCDSEGNCMLKDKLWKMPKISATGSYGGVSGSISTADNALTCDSEGNCMLKDKLLSFGGSYKGNSVSVSTADNALTCDSEGNCMLKDNLGGLSV